MLRMIGTPSARGAARRASSASLCRIDWTPIGASISGDGQPHAEHVDAEVAAGHVAEKPRHDPPAAEGLAVGAHGFFRPCPAGHIIVGGAVQHRLRPCVELLDRDGLAGHLSVEPRPVDLHLPP